MVACCRCRPVARAFARLVCAAAFATAALAAGSWPAASLAQPNTGINPVPPAPGAPSSRDPATPAREPMSNPPVLPAPAGSGQPAADGAAGRNAPGSGAAEGTSAPPGPDASRPAGAAPPARAPAAETSRPADPGRPVDASDGGRLLDRVVAVVNQEAVTQSELATRVALVTRQLRERGQLPPGAEQLEKQVLEQLIMDRLRSQAAKDAGIQPTESELDRAVAEIAQRSNVSLQTMREQIERQGLSFSGYREQIAGEIVSMRLRDRETRDKVTVSEAEIDAHLLRRGAIGATEFEIGQILIKLAPDADAGTARDRASRAQAIAARARSEDFEALAREVSEAPDALTGSNLGWRPADRLPQLFVDVVTPLQPGAISEPIRSPAGLHVLKLIGKRQGGGNVAGFGQTHVRHILLPAVTAAEMGEAKRRLVEFRRRIAAGESFEALARQFSVDTSASRGGDLGWVYGGDTVPDFEGAMNALAPGEVSEPVQTQFGLHLIQVLERRTDDSSPERLRASARQALREQKADEAFEQWLREQRDRAYVEYRLDSL
jgi:peptidyl-prolyl cis-trans isomerase SurA